MPEHASAREKGCPRDRQGDLVISIWQAYKAACAAAVREYFVSAQPGEVAATLQDLGKPQLGHVFVKQVRAPGVLYVGGTNPLQKVLMCVGLCLFSR